MPEARDALTWRSTLVLSEMRTLSESGVPDLRVDCLEERVDEAVGFAACLAAWRGVLLSFVAILAPFLRIVRS